MLQNKIFDFKDPIQLMTSIKEEPEQEINDS